ncbi:MAG: stalk domain-containing protein [Oscillospiraceae bacterium]|nr:stalk domain-containing protein [Oscillospiraceae bacterium]
MKTKKHIKLCVTAFLTAAMLCVTVFASSGFQSAQIYYNNIKIVIDGEEITPKDALGNTVDPFIMDGTTYLPVRAVSKALGMDVRWEESTYTVFLTSSVEPDDKPVEIEAVYRKISAAEAHQMMVSADNFILLDVRTEEEYRNQRIEGAILIPDYEIAAKAESKLPDKNAVILVYCGSGRRSESAARELVGLGYTNVYDFGAISSWPYGTVSG